MKMTTKQADKLIDAAQHAWAFTVTGGGPFPMDMLRYDRAWPATSDDAAALTMKSQREVAFRSLKEPTVDRWRSFGWAVKQQWEVR